MSRFHNISDFLVVSCTMGCHMWPVRTFTRDCQSPTAFAIFGSTCTWCGKNV